MGNGGSVLVRRGENGICLKKVNPGQGNKARVLCKLQCVHLNTY